MKSIDHHAVIEPPTPISVAHQVIHELHGLMDDECFNDVELTSLKECLDYMLCESSSHASKDEYLENLKRIALTLYRFQIERQSTQQDACRLIVLAALLCACAIAGYLKDANSSAWMIVNDARYYLGFAQGILHGGKAALSEKARRAARARHRKTDELKLMVVARYRLNQGEFTSKDQAAEVIAREVGKPFRTVRDWLKESKPPAHC